ncbi:MAG: OmpA family protein [Bacteroidota bacterium]
MKKMLLAFTVTLILLLTETSSAQLAKDSWAFGFGFRFPRFVSINIEPLNSNYGGYLSIQRNFSEHVGLRLKGGYSHLESEFTDAASQLQTTTTNIISGDLDLIYYLVPCEPVSPYFFGGIGVAYRMNENYVTTSLDENQVVPELNGGFGIEWGIDTDWELVTELGYHITNNSELEGALGAGEVSGRDTYLGVNLGLQYYFDKGAPSQYCQLYSGLSVEKPEPVDYDRIEEMIKSHIPREVVKEVVVEKPVTSESEKWVLVGVNFDFNSAKITPESYPILYDAAKTLLKYPDMKVEIQGYTDNIGSEQYNKTLSQRRADTVKKYLLSKGVSQDRLTSVGYGESNPIADNKTADGRAMNRRIEFKIR